ncbi:hypothetical protein ACFL0Q_03180 [Thermodesulfobacteriota bacterium]
MEGKQYYMEVWNVSKDYSTCLDSSPYTAKSCALLDAAYNQNSFVTHVLNNIYKTKGSDDNSDIDNILQNRKNLIRSKIELILLQLDQRKKTNQEIIYCINRDLCNAQTLIMELGHDDKGLGKNKLAVEKIKFDLENQQRMEEVGYFRDTGMLNRELRDALIEYLDHDQKDALINEMEGEI